MRSFPEEPLGVCVCPVSRVSEQPTPWGLNTLDWKCCTVCGYPTVHRMAPHILEQALSKMPRLADQLVLGLERGAA